MDCRNEDEYQEAVPATNLSKGRNYQRFLRRRKVFPVAERGQRTGGGIGLREANAIRCVNKELRGEVPAW